MGIILKKKLLTAAPAVVCRGRGLEERGEETLDVNSRLPEAKMNQSLFSETGIGTGISNDTQQHLPNHPG